VAVSVTTSPACTPLEGDTARAFVFTLRLVATGLNTISARTTAGAGAQILLCRRYSSI
jgi:hypothetical protein